MDSQHIPGLSLAVVRDGKLVLAKGYGKASVELDAPVTPATLFALASVSKQFTAAAIMLLVEAGKVGLNDPIANYFSWVPKEWSEVKVRHLLTHTSGIREEENKGDFLEWEREEHNQEEIVRTAFGPLLARPGEKYRYSNTEYRVLGMLIEKVSGQSYWDFLEQHIFHPLGMGATRNSDPRTVIPNRARGYGFSDGRLINRDPVSASAAFSDGALISSVLDIVKWDAALNSEMLLKRSSLEEMWTPVRSAMGPLPIMGLGGFCSRLRTTRRSPTAETCRDSRRAFGGSSMIGLRWLSLRIAKPPAPFEWPSVSPVFMFQHCSLPKLRSNSRGVPSAMAHQLMRPAAVLNPLNHRVHRRARSMFAWSLDGAISSVRNDRPQRKDSCPGCGEPMGRFARSDLESEKGERCRLLWSCHSRPKRRSFPRGAKFASTGLMARVVPSEAILGTIRRTRHLNSIPGNNYESATALSERPTNGPMGNGKCPG